MIVNFAFSFLCFLARTDINVLPLFVLRFVAQFCYSVNLFSLVSHSFIAYDSSFSFIFLNELLARIILLFSSLSFCTIILPLCFSIIILYLFSFDLIILYIRCPLFLYLFIFCFIIFVYSWFVFLLHFHFLPYDLMLTFLLLWISFLYVSFI